MASFEGKVTRKRVAGGSKSERECVVLEAGSGDLVLRRKGGNPFHDPDLDALVGQTIRAEGTLLGGYNLVMSAWEPV